MSPSATTNPAEPEVAATATLLVHVASGIVRASRRRLLRDSGPSSLSLSQLRALSTLGDVPGMSLSQLAKSIELTLPAVSRLVDGLVQRGLVRSRAGQEDGRRLELELSPAGKAAQAAAVRAASEVVTDSVAALTGAERRQLARLLERLEGLMAEKKARP